MIALTTAEGQVVRWIPEGASSSERELHFHKTFGFLSASALAHRLRSRRLRGLRSDPQSAFRFRIESGDSLAVKALSGCQATLRDGSWRLATPMGEYRVAQIAESAAPVRAGVADEQRQQDARDLALAILLIAFVIGVFLLVPRAPQIAPEPEILEPIAVKVPMAKQKSVAVPSSQALPKEIQNVAKDAKVRRAVQNELGFLGMLGKKELSKALGGMPSQIADASPGAGAGGKAGSGGEMLMGLGQGVRRTTVGNSGVAGLGGVGTKGAGGGAGGYGNAMVGSGDGRALSAMPLAQDIVMEGGLDRSVIQATIAKYISQVRACYERGLGRKPGMSGQVNMRFEIAASGALEGPRVEKSSLGDSEVEQCITQRMGTWMFPKPLGGVRVKVNYPFLLRPVGS